MRVRVAGHGLVDRVVDDLPDAVVQPGRTGAADVHAGPFPDRFEAFEDLHVPGPVGATSLRQHAPFQGVDRQVLPWGLSREFAGQPTGITMASSLPAGCDSEGRRASKRRNSRRFAYRTRTSIRVTTPSPNSSAKRRSRPACSYRNRVAQPGSSTTTRRQPPSSETGFACAAVSRADQRGPVGEHRPHGGAHQDCRGPGAHRRATRRAAADRRRPRPRRRRSCWHHRAVFEPQHEIGRRARGQPGRRTSAPSGRRADGAAVSRSDRVELGEHVVEQQDRRVAGVGGDDAVRGRDAAPARANVARLAMRACGPGARRCASCNSSRWGPTVVTPRRRSSRRACGERGGEPGLRPRGLVASRRPRRLPCRRQRAVRVGDLGRQSHDELAAGGGERLACLGELRVPHVERERGRLVEAVARRRTASARRCAGEAPVRRPTAAGRTAGAAATSVSSR